MLGHFGRTTLIRLLNLGIVKGPGLTKHSILVNNCDTCAKGKMSKQKFGDRKFTSLSTVPGGTFHIDLASVTVPTFGGNKYFLGIVDEYSGYAWVYLLKLKSDTAAELIRFFTRFYGKFGRWQLSSIQITGANLLAMNY